MWRSSFLPPRTKKRKDGSVPAGRRSFSRWRRAVHRVVCPLFLTVACSVAWAQAPDYNNVGRAATKEEIQAWDISVGPQCRELPPGRGTAKEGAELFAKKCAACHGLGGEGSPRAPRLVGGKGTLTTPQAIRTIGSYWPFATTVWDYI